MINEDIEILKEYGIGENTIKHIKKAGYKTLGDITKSTPEHMSHKVEIGLSVAEKIIEKVKRILDSNEKEMEEIDKIKSGIHSFKSVQKEMQSYKDKIKKSISELLHVPIGDIYLEENNNIEIFLDMTCISYQILQKLIKLEIPFYIDTIDNKIAIELGED